MFKFLNVVHLIQKSYFSNSHDFIGEFTTSYRELSRGQSQFNVYEVSIMSIYSLSGNTRENTENNGKLLLP